MYNANNDHLFTVGNVFTIESDKHQDWKFIVTDVKASIFVDQAFFLRGICYVGGELVTFGDARIDYCWGYLEDGRVVLQEVNDNIDGSDEGHKMKSFSDFLSHHSFGRRMLVGKHGTIETFSWLIPTQSFKENGTIPHKHWQNEHLKKNVVKLFSEIKERNESTETLLRNLKNLVEVGYQFYALACRAKKKPGLIERLFSNNTNLIIKDFESVYQNYKNCTHRDIFPAFGDFKLRTIRDDIGFMSAAFFPDLMTYDDPGMGFIDYLPTLENTLESLSLNRGSVDKGYVYSNLYTQFWKNRISFELKESSLEETKEKSLRGAGCFYYHPRGRLAEDKIPVHFMNGLLRPKSLQQLKDLGILIFV